ncbi:MAG: hypothetical protein ACFBSG_15055 [Leptolyngbyaceae cyanobacterium]
MNVRVATWSSIALATLLVAVTGWKPLRPDLSAWAQQIRTYGRDGRDGHDGRDGQDGRAGQTQSLRADGTFQQVELVGAAAQDGEDGDRGDRPSCPAQPRDVRYDLQAPDGGDGGDGGRGGDGGQGGDIILYYTDIAQLRQVVVNAAGGRPGRGGRGGVGAAGCRCDDRRWTVQVCREGSCREEHYDCRDGDTGQYGRNGQAGQPGDLGQVWLVNREGPLLSEQPEVTQPLSNWLEQPVTLSRHVWEARIGAGALLASGSVVNDRYAHYVERLELPVQLQWQAGRSPRTFLATSPRVRLSETGTVQLDLPETLWVASRIEQSARQAIIVIDQVARADQVTDLAWGTQTGRGDDWAISVIDLGGESEFVSTQFELVYRTTDDDPRDNRRVRYEEQFSGIVPASAITQDQNRFVLSLGQLPISDHYFRQGTHMQLELRVMRSLGQNSADQTLEWQGQL